VAAAVALADDRGVGSLSMRMLAQQLGIEAMSLYHYVTNKDDLLDSLVDAVFSEIVLPTSDMDWVDAMRARAISVREVLHRHPWALGLLDSRASPGPATLRHHDAVIESCATRASQWRWPRMLSR
jgi:AcrR family transcriptional regulator